MTEEIIKTTEAATVPVPAPVVATASHSSSDRGGSRDNKNRRDRRPSSRPPRPRSEFDQRNINVRRVTRVVSGGRRFSFSVSIIIGNRKGKVGVGVGKAGDTALAVDKAVRAAKKNMITIPLTKNSSIPHEVNAKFCSSLVKIIPVEGRGLVAGSSVRFVLELAGITDVIAKISSGSKNGLNNAQAAIEALKQLKA